MKRTVEVTEANFEREVLKSSRPVLVEFAPRWSFPALRLEEVLDELATDFADYVKAARAWRSIAVRISDCGTASDAFRRSYVSSMAKSAPEFLGRRAHKQFFLS
jgi:hypothetical protein